MHFTINLVMNFCSAQITAFPILTKLQILFPDAPRDRGRVTDHNNTNSLPNSFWIMNGIFNMPYKNCKTFFFPFHDFLLIVSCSEMHIFSSMPNNILINSKQYLIK